MKASAAKENKKNNREAPKTEESTKQKKAKTVNAEPEKTKNVKAKTVETKTVQKEKTETPAPILNFPASVEASDQSKVIKQLITTGREKGLLTLDEINDALPSDESNAEQLDEIFQILAEMNIEVVDGSGNVRLNKTPAPSGEEETEELDLDPSVPTREGELGGGYLGGMGNSQVRDRE